MHRDRPTAVDAGLNVMDRVEHQLDVSRFHADRGDRPPALGIPALPDVDRLLTGLSRASRASRREFLTFHDAVASAASGEPEQYPEPTLVDHNRAMLRRGGGRA
jgi:hypothetical protein